MRLLKSLFRKKRKKESLLRYVMSLTHLWLGLLSMIVIFVVCLSGSIYAFRTPFIELKNRHLINASIPKNTDLLRIDEIEDIFHGKGLEIMSIVIPANKKKNLVIRYTGSNSHPGNTFGTNKYPDKTDSHKSGSVAADSTSARLINHTNPVNLSETGTVHRANLADSTNSEHKTHAGTGYFNPFTGQEVHGKYDRSAEQFFQTVLSLHKNLAMGRKGKQIVGASVLIFIVMLLSGLFLWWPQSWRWKTLRSSLLVRWKAKSYRVIHGLHNVFGMYAFLLLLFIAITGLYITYPWMKNAIIVTLGGEPILKKEATTENRVSDSFAVLLQEMLQKESEKRDTVHTAPFPLAKVKQMADEYLDYHATTTIVMPDDNNPRYTVSKVNTHNFLGAKVNDVVTFDKKGEMRSLDRFSDKPLHRQFIEISLPLHTGEIIGLPGIILYALVALIGCSLPVTGFLLWWKRVGKSRS